MRKEPISKYVDGSLWYQYFALDDCRVFQPSDKESARQKQWLTYTHPYNQEIVNYIIK